MNTDITDLKKEIVSLKDQVSLLVKSTKELNETNKVLEKAIEDLSNKINN